VISLDAKFINNVQTPTLFIAQALVHEAIHANLFLAVKKLNGGVTPTNSDFGILYEQYRQKQNWQHNFMADRYRNLIAGALQEVHPLLGDEHFMGKINNGYPSWDWDEFYANLAWVGLLRDTIVGENYIANPDNSYNLSFYYEGAKANSTKTPKCN
jgi:hypothetical protein